MIIWSLALVLFGCLGFAGWAFGGIRAAFAFVGLFVALLAAKIFGHSLEPAVGHLGIKNPMLPGLVAPFIVFVVVLSVFKIFGYVAHGKVDHYFKYKAGDLRMGLWNRLNPRLGLCLGLANASVYLILISMVIYPFSYATAQLASGDNANWSVKLLNSAGEEMKSAGMDRVVGAIDPMPEDYYQAVDLAGLLYHNPLYEARLKRYPAFLSMGQRSEFQALGDKDFTQLLQTEAPISTIWNDPKVQPIVSSPDLLKEIWGLVQPNIKDLREFLQTGLSHTFDEKILGQWDFNLNGALTELRRAKPNMTAREMQASRGMLTLAFAKTTLVATVEKTVFVKNFGKVSYVPANATPGMAPPPSPPPGGGAPPGRGGRGGGRGGPGGAGGLAGGPPRGGPPMGAAPPNMIPKVDFQDFQGTWQSDGLDYRLSLQGPRFDAVVDGDKMTLTGGPVPMVFSRNY